MYMCMSVCVPALYSLLLRSVPLRRFVARRIQILRAPVSISICIRLLVMMLQTLVATCGCGISSIWMGMNAVDVQKER